MALMALSASTASRSARAGMPVSRANAASRSGLRPTQQTNSILADWLAALASTRPQAPTPINAALSRTCAIGLPRDDPDRNYTDRRRIALSKSRDARFRESGGG